MSSRAKLIIAYLNEMQGQGTGPEGTGGTDVCVCPKCKVEFPHRRGVPCNQVHCPECGTELTGQGALGDKSA